MLYNYHRHDFSHFTSSIRSRYLSSVTTTHNGYNAIAHAVLYSYTLTNMNHCGAGDIVSNVPRPAFGDDDQALATCPATIMQSKTSPLSLTVTSTSQ